MDKTSTKFDDKEKLSILQNKFVSVFLHKNRVVKYQFSIKYLSIQVKDKIFSKEKLKLSLKKSCGPDEMHL